MIYMGIDASSSSTGVCIFKDRKLIFYDKIKPKKKIDFRDNTCQIIEDVVAVANKYKPDIIYMENVPKFIRGKNILSPLVSLGAVQGIFHYELVYRNGFKIIYLDVHSWRGKLNFLKGERTRDKQKSKAVNYVNEMFKLNLKYTEGKTLVENDDDIAEAICLVVSELSN